MPFIFFLSKVPFKSPLAFQLVLFNLCLSTLCRYAEGLTGLLCAAKKPFPARAKELASFGAQAALVAGSPYYQLLVGMLLGYKTDNIDAHVMEKGGKITAPIMHQALYDLAVLDDDVEATLPWREGRVV